MIDEESEHIDVDVIYQEGPWMIAYFRKKNGVKQVNPKVHLYYHGREISSLLNIREKTVGVGYPIPESVVEKYLFWSEMTRD